MRHSLRAASLVLALVVGLLTAGLSAPAARADFPIPLPTSPEGDPPGANDWDCRPSAKRPVPVILVHGTGGDRKHLLERLSSSLADAGYCVYSLDYGNRGLNDIARSAGQLKKFVQRVRKATGAAKVSMVGHSQGGMMPRYYIKNLGGARVVDDLIGVAPSNHGTEIVPLSGGGDNPFSALIELGCAACLQQAAGSEFLAELNAGDETPGKVSYTQITSAYDEVVVPHTSGYLADGPRTTNLTLQDVCPAELAEHVLIPLATPTISIVLEALKRKGPAPDGFRPAC